MESLNSVPVMVRTPPESRITDAAGTHRYLVLSEAQRARTLETLVLLAEKGRQHHNDRVTAIAKQHMPDVEVREVPASHHTIPFEGADKLNRELTAFLA